MGKQTYFFMTFNDEKLLLDLISKNKDKIVDIKGNPLSFEEIEKRTPIYTGEVLNPPPIGKFFIVSDNCKIIKSANGFIEESSSEVIEIWRSSIKNTNQMWNGRIWVKTKYYDDEGQKVTKPEWLIKKYSKYEKWIKKNCKKSKNSGFHFYIGAEAYKMYKEYGFKMMNAPKVSIEFD